MKFWFPITVFFKFLYHFFKFFFFFFGLCIWILPSHCDMKKLRSLLSTWYSQSSEMFLCVWSMPTFIHQADRSGFRCSLPDSTMECQENKAMGLSILQNLSGQLRSCSRGTKKRQETGENTLATSDFQPHGSLPVWFRCSRWRHMTHWEVSQGKAKGNPISSRHHCDLFHPQDLKSKRAGRAEPRRERELADCSHVT